MKQPTILSDVELLLKLYADSGRNPDGAIKQIKQVLYRELNSISSLTGKPLPVHISLCQKCKKWDPDNAQSGKGYIICPSCTEKEGQGKYVGYLYLKKNGRKWTFIKEVRGETRSHVIGKFGTYAMEQGYKKFTVKWEYENEKGEIVKLARKKIAK